MARAPRHAVNWSAERGLYEWFTQRHVVRRFDAGDDAAWVNWLDEATSFAFHGRLGALNVYQERRPRGGRYWYAYHTDRHGIRKRYLGQTVQVTLARLEATAQALASAAAPATGPAASARSDGKQPLVLAAKLTPPRLPRALVTRERLLAALDEALSSPLTLLSASTGWGKTTVLATWASRQTAPVAWLSLDELDDTPTRFWVALIAALRVCGRYAASLGTSALAHLQSPEPPPLSTTVTALLYDLESQSTSPDVTAPVVLILDDYQVISDPAIHESLRFVLAHPPVHLRLILASRVDPDLPLPQLRARGELTEIRMDELRFREEEAQRFLGHLLAPALADNEVRQLARRTEGWIAGLQLAALALQKRAEHTDRAAFLRAFTGGQRYLLDYVQADILAHLPTHVRDFLFQTAILSRLDAEVCQAVTAVSDRQTCQQLLEELERSNLFLVPLDEERRWYRLHDLFREALLAALDTSQPDQLPELHRRAASYYEAREMWSEAIAHHLAAGDYSIAARLIEQTAEQFWLHGQAEMVAHWVLALPQPVLRAHAFLTLTVALYLLNTVTSATGEHRARTHAQVRELLSQVESALWPQTLPAEGDNPGARQEAMPAAASAAEDTRLQWRARALHIALVLLEAAARGEHEQLGHIQPEIQAIQDAMDHDEDAVWQLVPLSYAFLLHYTVRRETALLLPRLLEVKRQVSQSGSPFAAVKVRQYLAIAALDAGQLRLAHAESAAALHLIDQLGGYAVLQGDFAMVQVEVLYQWNRLEEARRRLHAVLHDAAIRQQLDVLGGSYFALLRIELARGDRSAAEEALRALEQLVQREGFGTYPGILPAQWALWRLAQGQVAEVATWAAGMRFPDADWESSRYFEFRMVIRTYCAQRRWREALKLLERWRGHLDRAGNTGLTLLYLAQLLVALHHAGEGEQAHHVAARLFALTAPEGYLRLYLDEGEPMRQALRAWSALHRENDTVAPSARAHVAQVLSAFEHELHGMSRAPAVSPVLVPAAQPAARSPLADASLTRREQDVLRLLAEGASNQEIAHTLMIELSTVKKHVSNLLSKLGATNRTQAIAQARTRSLV
jgi:LuxR family maltose regulon positive regulatory protein